jgi:hypothetical protein
MWSDFKTFGRKRDGVEKSLARREDDHKEADVYNPIEQKGSADRSPPNLIYSRDSGLSASAENSLLEAIGRGPICAALSRSNPYRLFPTHTDICHSDSA